MSANGSAGLFEEVFSLLQITDHEESAFTCVSQDTESTASTSHDHAATTQDHAKLLLNPFLQTCGVSPIVRPWQTWSNCSESTRRWCTKKSA